MAAKNLKLQVAEKQNHQETLVFVEELKRQWMATIDALVDPLMIVNPQYEIVKANKAMAVFAKQSKVQSLIGKKCYEVFAGNKKPCESCRLTEAIKSAEPLGFELSLSQNTRHFEVTSQPFYNAKNQLDGVVQVYRDRTEAKLLAQQLSQSEKLASIGLLAGGIAHEINNPLGGILVFTQMLLRELPKNSSGYLDAKEIEQAALRCKEIVESLLEFARTQPHSKSPKKQLEKVDVRTVVEQAVSFIKMGFDLHSFDLSVNLDERFNTIKGDKNKLIQV
ncbi:MAG: PAS domain-containing protein, partial [Oligoflexales bacterium]|nr:PAS domain-containing protein [Oligoflexales bacterium]